MCEGLKITPIIKLTIQRIKGEWILSEFKRFSPLFAALLLIAVISIAGYFAIRDLAGTQSQQHQQSVSPIFGLIESELVEPLHIAKTLNKIGVYKDYFDQETPNEEALLKQLQYYSTLFNLEFYVAHEKSRKQFNSDGRVLDLIEGNVTWYFVLKDEYDSEIQAVLGKRDDVHLYIDVRQYDSNGEFIGFIGLGKSLNDFIVSFEEYKVAYGHEFLFVNNLGEIVLSSRKDLLPTRSKTATSNIGITDISDLDWYEAFTQETKGQTEPSLVVNSKNGDLLVSQLAIETLNWSLYLVTPLSERQEEVNQSFAIYIGFGLLVLLLLYKVACHLFDYYANKVSRKLNYDPLTKLANRNYAQFFFARSRRQNREMALIFIDLDHFKLINDSFGHNAGDEILKASADCICNNMRFQDIAVRWSGQQFVIILPNIDQDGASEIAEQCRVAIAENKITVSSSFVSVTASVGLVYSRNLSDALNLMVEWAEQSMRLAKTRGKNQVVIK